MGRNFSQTSKSPGNSTLFGDLRQAYDSVDREMLLRVMFVFGIPTKLVRLTRFTMTVIEPQTGRSSNSNAFQHRPTVCQPQAARQCKWNIAEISPAYADHKN